jgi:hypothetical protein
MPNNWLLNERQQTIDNWLRAAANFYGFVTPRIFLILFNRYNKPKLLKAELLKYWHKFDVKSWKYYALYDNAIVRRGVGLEKMDEIQFRQQGKKYYMPTNVELLNYLDPDYYEKTLESERVYQYMRITLKLKQEDADEFMKKVTWMMRIDEPIVKVMDVLNDFQLVLHGLDHANEFLWLMSDLSNHTRKWSNCGFTPEELYKGRPVYTEIFSRN